MKKVVLSISVPATVYPTITVKKEHWQEALACLKAGGQPKLLGAIEIGGCRGGSTSGGLAEITVRLTVLEGEDDDYDSEDYTCPTAVEGQT